MSEQLQQAYNTLMAKAPGSVSEARALYPTNIHFPS